MSNHATRGSGGSYCCNCASSMGEAVKVQPTTVDGEAFCPRCFAWLRMHREPERFQAHQTAAVHCQICGWLSVCFSVRVGKRASCGHCGRGGALIAEPTESQVKELEQQIRAMAEEARS